MSRSKSSTRKAQPVAASLSSSSTSAFAPFLRLLDLGEIWRNFSRYQNIRKHQKTSENIRKHLCYICPWQHFRWLREHSFPSKPWTWAVLRHRLICTLRLPWRTDNCKRIARKCAHQSATRSFQVAAKWRFVGFPMNHLDRLDMDMARLYIVYECTPSIGVSQEAQRKKPEGHISMPASDIRYQLIRTKADSNLLEFNHCNSSIYCHGRTIWQYSASWSYIFGPRMDERHIRNWSYE